MCFEFFSACFGGKSSASVPERSSLYNPLLDEDTSPPPKEAEEEFRLGMHFRNQANPNEAGNHFLKAHRAGHPRGLDEALKEMYTLAMIFKKQNNWNEAVEFFEFAATGIDNPAKGHAEAQCELGGCYLRGDGVPKDKEKAREWLLLADKNGARLAKHILQIMDGSSTTLNMDGGGITISFS